MDTAAVYPISRRSSGEGEHRRLRAWGVTYAMIAEELSVSRQYVWQVLHRTVPVSPRMDSVVRGAAEELIRRQQQSWTTGKKMRAARVFSGFTLKQAAAMAGYTWVAVQRWEKDLCLPKPGVLWHLRMLYGVDENWTPGTAGTRLSA